jgi:hypothetical protein
LKQDCTKLLDINLIETSLDQLLECYRQALRAVELLPAHGGVPRGQLIAQITQPINTAMRGFKRLRTSWSQSRIRNADWIRSRFAVRPLARMFLSSHIRSKLRSIADRLEVERLAIGHMNKNEIKQLDTVIKNLRDFDKRLSPRRIGWFKWFAGIWVIIAPLLTTYLTTSGLPNITKIAGAGTLVSFLTYFGYSMLLVSFPLFFYFGLGAFRWKRLILLGQIGDINIEIADSVVLRWTLAPQTNTYEYESRFFETLGLPKPREFPWDAVLSPAIVLLIPLAMSFFVFALLSAKPGWFLLVSVVSLALFFLCLILIIRPISRARKNREQRGSC